MNTGRIIVLLLSLSCIAQPAFSQRKHISGNVRDFHSDEPIPFASLTFLKTSIGGLTDSSGNFSITVDEWPSDSLVITCVGYVPFSFYIDKTQQTIIAEIEMERGKFNEGVNIKAKVNKGLFLWRKIVEHKPQNDRYRFDNFSYELYNKLELDIKNVNFKTLSKIKLIKPVGDIINQNVDTTEGIKYLPTYLTEALSNYYYQKKPLKRREVIKAINNKGFENESIEKFLGGMDQNINVYNNFIPVFIDRLFVSPISDNGDLYYNYNVTDTQQTDNNRYYHFVFTPKRKGTSTFEGDCWVHAGTFAIQKMNLRLGKDANLNFVKNLSLIQEYRLIDDSTWFLAKDKFIADIEPLGKNIPAVIGRKTATYRNVVINDTSVTNELNKNKILEEVITLPAAREKDNAFWDESRHEELSKTEAGIIKMIDTLLVNPRFQQLTKQIKFVATGYVNVGTLELGPWYNWFTGNSWEGFRMRFDVGTNKKFSTQWWLHGYLAYGFTDKRFKGKAEVFYLPKKDPRRYIHASYIDDLDFGQNYYGEVTSDNIFAVAIRKPDIPIKFINIQEAKLAFFNEHRIGLSEQLSFSHKVFTPLKNMPSKDSFPSVNGGDPMTSFEVSVRLRFAYLERFLEGNFFRISVGSPYPITEITLTKGIPGVFKSSYNYFKISGSISDFMKIPPAGSISYQVYAGKTFGTLPYVLLDIAPGNELYYYNKYAFNMMNRYEFIHDRYVGVGFEHNVGNGLFRFIPKLRFRQFWTVKALWGGLSDANKIYNFKLGNNFQTLNGNTYMEIGTGIDNILRVLRVDFIWRILPSSMPLNTKRFGIFGSFRLSF